MRTFSIFICLTILLTGIVQAAGTCKDKKLSEIKKDECEKKIAAEKCEQKYFPTSNLIEYHKAYDGYSHVFDEFTKKNGKESFPDSKSQLVTYKHASYDEDNNSNEALRLNWASDLYKRSKGKILYIPGTSCTSGSHCMDSFAVTENGKTKVIQINSPYFQGFCGGVSDLERRINLLSNNYKEGDADCLNFIQTHPLVDGYASGEGLLSFMKVGFNKNGKLTYDAKKISTYDKNEFKNQNGDKIIQEKLEKNKSKFTTEKNQSGQLLSASLSYENSRHEIVTNEYSFKYLNGQCLLYKQAVTIGKGLITYPDIDKCLSIREIQHEYSERRFDAKNPVDKKLEITVEKLFEEFYAEGKIFYDRAPRWCDKEINEEKFKCRATYFLPQLYNTCNEYSSFYAKYVEAADKKSGKRAKRTNKAKSQ